MKKFDFMPNLSIDSLSHTQHYSREEKRTKTKPPRPPPTTTK
jgi:hypothetical protein